MRKPTPWFLSIGLVLSLLSFTFPSTTSVNHTNHHTQTELYRHTSVYKRLAFYHDQSELPSYKDYSSSAYTYCYLSAVCGQQITIQYKKYAKSLSAIQFKTFMPYTPRSMTENLARSLRG